MMMDFRHSLFPFTTIRKGQKEFLEDCRKSIEEKKHLIAHAPTGIGKTVAVLSPALEFVLKNNKTIFFLTPKHTQHKIVVDTLKKIKEKFKVNFVAVDFIGKQWLCPHPKVHELSSREFNEFCKAQKKDERCKYYKNVHRRSSENRKKIIEKIKKKILHSEEVKLLCRENMFCPYEISVLAARDANVIICDYFHLFSGKVRKAFLSKLGKEFSNLILIIDEAHNLPERIRKLLSATLTEFTIRGAIKEANFLGYEIVADALKNMRRVLKKLSRKNLESEVKEIYLKREDFNRELVEEIEMPYSELADMINDLGDEILRMPKRYKSYSKTVARFLKKWNKEEDLGYVRILKKDQGKIFLHYKCLDPGISSKEIFSKSHATIFMSGTLVPLEMYSKILDLEEGRVLLREYESPFPKENRLLLLVPDVTTQYKKRSELMYERYAKKISRIIEKIPGNLAIFFPSYDIANKITKFLDSRKKEILLEKKEMKKEERIFFYNRLMTLQNSEGGILAGVQAGSFSEGVDYAENLLNAVIVVGLPLEIPSLEVKSLIEYYDFKFKRGWDYGYIFPAMNRALQAAGRCIRSETDRAAIILMDERFKWRNYSKCFPKDFLPIVTEIPERYVEMFFFSVR